MFGKVLISAVTLMHLYVIWRASSVPVIKRKVRPWRLIAAGAFMWLVFVLGRLYAHNASGNVAAAIELIGMDWMAVVFLLTVTMLAADLATGFGLIFKRHAPSIRGWALAAGLALAAIAIVQGMRPPVVSEYEVRMKGLPRALDGTVIAAISDTHAGALIGRAWLKARVEQVNAERPDMIVLLGDIFEGHGEPDRAMVDALGGLKARLGVWAVLGNHEFLGQRQLTRIDGVRVLSGAWAEPAPGLVLAGVDDQTPGGQLGAGPIRQTLTGRPEGATVLLAHTPWRADEAAAMGAGLMLSGHTHGGQIWPFGYLVKRRYRFLAGRYDVGGMALIVSRGAGTWGPRMRLWQPGEILRVTLRAE